MNIRVHVKQLGSRRDKIVGVPFRLARAPQTVAELIAEAVRSCVAEYNARLEQSEATPLTQADINARAELGKIAFGLNFGGKPADEPQAIAHAQQAYADGIFRIFIGETECGDLTEAVSLAENDALTFIRLTMLTGGFF